MNFPQELKYSKDHEWFKSTGAASGLVGITDYAQHQLGDLVFVNLPQPGDEVTAGQPLGDVESVKAVSDVLSPVTGVVKAVNNDLLDNPASINQAPYGAWFIEVENITAQDDLMDAAAYQKVCEEEQKGG
ncbi:MAG: glycine cleavage system protein GcvH [Treponema sp.]|nr:glycine cleavage system protein GcvH [Treponema sp.]